MKGVEKIITYICIAGTLAVLMLSIDFPHSIVIFLLAGIVPGTDWSIPATDMLAATATLLTVVIFSPIYLPAIKNFVVNYYNEPIVETSKKSKNTDKKAKLRRQRA